MSGTQYFSYIHDKNKITKQHIM